MSAPILAPAAVLVLWSVVMLYWMAGTRIPAMGKSGADLKSAKPGGRGVDLEGVLPDTVNWKGHNYTHLMEQPTLFYAAIAILALAGAGDGVNVQLAWGYTGLRIAHSLWQSLVNTIPVRFTLFLASSLCLTVLAINAVRVTLGV
ncbi:MAG: hypothetical protein RLZZ561_2151 [Pseudomonadota bacterium]|jgi:hypothetical protein